MPRISPEFGVRRPESKTRERRANKKRARCGVPFDRLMALSEVEGRGRGSRRPIGLCQLPIVFVYFGEPGVVACRNRIFKSSGVRD